MMEERRKLQNIVRVKHRLIPRERGGRERDGDGEGECINGQREKQIEREKQGIKNLDKKEANLRRYNERKKMKNMRKKGRSKIQ